jgi:hypothetical protein
MGVEGFKADVERRFGKKLERERPFSFDSSVDKFGWSQDYKGNHHFTMFIENGRIQDEPEKQFKTGLEEIAKVHKGNFRLTANQHLILSDIATEDLPQIKSLLAKYKLDNLDFTGLRLSSSACVAFPTWSVCSSSPGIPPSLQMLTLHLPLLSQRSRHGRVGAIPSRPRYQAREDHGGERSPKRPHRHEDVRMR